MKKTTILNKTVLSIGLATLLVGCGGGGGDSTTPSDNVNTNAIVTPTSVVASVVYDNSWVYNVSGNLQFSLGANVKQVQITSLKVQIGDQAVQSIPFNQVVVQAVENQITTETIAIDTISLIGDWIPETGNRTIKITPVGSTIAGNTFVANSATVAINGFGDSESETIENYTMTVTQSKTTINPYGESNVGFSIVLKDENGVVDTTSRLKISSPLVLDGFTYSSAYTSSRTFYVTFPENKTSNNIDYTFNVSIENIELDKQKTITNDLPITFTQAATSTEIPFTLKGDSGIASTTNELPDLSSNGNALITLGLLNSSYNGYDYQLDIYDMSNGGTLPIYRDIITDIEYGVKETFLVNKDENTYWPTNADIVNSSTTPRDLLFKIAIMDGTTKIYEYSEIVNQEGVVVTDTDERTIIQTGTTYNNTRYKDTTGNTTGYFSLTGDNPPFVSSDDEYQDFGFAAQIVDPDGLVNLSQSYIGGMLWNTITSNTSLLNFNNENIKIPNTNTIKFDIAFNDTTTITTNKTVDVLFFGEDGSFVSYPITISSEDAPSNYSEDLQYELSEFSAAEVGPTLPSSSSIFFTINDTLNIANTPILNLKLLSNEQYVTLSGGVVTNGGKDIAVTATEASHATVIVDQAIENTTTADISVPYLAYITVNDKIASNVVDGSSINVLTNTANPQIEYSATANGPESGLEGGSTGQIAWGVTLEVGTTTSTPQIHFVMLEGSNAATLSATTGLGDSGTIGITTNVLAAGAEDVTVTLAYYVTIDGKRASEISTVQFTVLAPPAP